MKKYLALITLFLATSCAHHARNGHHEKMWGSMDANKDGKVTKEEFTKGHEAHFVKLDTNGDGVITKDEKKSFQKNSCESSDKK